MKHLLTIISCFVALFMSAQVPGYVPQDGLIAMFSMDSTMHSSIAPFYTSNNAEALSYSIDRNGNDAGAFNPLESNSNEGANLTPDSLLNSIHSITVSFWVKLESNETGDRDHFIEKRNVNEGLKHFILSQGDEGLYAYYGSTNDSLHVTAELLPVGLWTHVAWTFQASENEALSRIYVDGTVVDEHLTTGSLSSSSDDTFRIGGGVHPLYVVSGSMDDLFLWNRSLEPYEILQLFLEENLVFGCTDELACNFDPFSNFEDGTCLIPGCDDELACNYDPQAGCDNGSCDYTCCPGPGCCDTGTTWDYEIEKCVPINSCPEDLNYDGIIGVEDLLTLLSSFGTPCDPPVAEWTCGDPFSYHGYDYETVLIGEQCWFAENLRTQFYQNGDSIIYGSSDSDWSNASLGMQCIYDLNPEMHTTYGRLYNWHAIEEERQVCPSEWRIPTYDEFWVLIEFLGGSFEAGPKLKDSILWNGTNLSGYSGLPGGLRHANAEFDNLGTEGRFWSSSVVTSGPNSGLPLGMELRTYSSGEDVGGTLVQKEVGKSIRCLKD